MANNRVIYPGSFDPITRGHIDIINRARNLFAEIIVAVFNNPRKNPLFTMEEREALLQQATADLTGVRVDSFSGLTVDYVREQEAAAILRGLRAVSDFEGEFQMSAMNKELNSEVETVFLMTSTRYAFLSSSVIKEVAQFGGDVSELVPPCVEEALKEKFNL